MAKQQRAYFETFRDLANFHRCNVTYILGRGFFHLRDHLGLSSYEVGECFGYTAQNVCFATDFYLEHQTSGSPTLAPREQGARTANVPPDDGVTPSVKLDRPRQKGVVKKAYLLNRKERA